MTVLRKTGAYNSILLSRTGPWTGRIRRVMFGFLFLFWSWFSACGQQRFPEPETGRMAGQPSSAAKSPEPGLLFYLSGDQNYTADFAAGGQKRPNFNDRVKIIPDGAVGAGFQADDRQLLSYWAPGNIFAQRGTVSFYWRSRYPAGPTPFPIFRVGFADHSSWDMVWLRIDYNGSGFDAFVTDAGLSRTRVSYYMDTFPKPEEWTHIALSWDETEGIRLYVNGKLVGKRTNTGEVYDTGLDQFGPHSRIISPYQVQSRYNFIRGGDFDELRIYDRMLSDENIARLSRGEKPRRLAPARRDLNQRRWREEWWTQNGWNLPNKPPALLPGPETTVRKVEIHKTIDVKRWMWKANDGIRETTWPGVYNMSRLPGRYDYFVLPDWDTYSVSGQSVKFYMPDEPWNHLEIWGTAWGQLTYESGDSPDYTFGVRTRTQVKSYRQLGRVRQGGVIRFDNALIEEPIGEFGAYYVRKGSAPRGTADEIFSLFPAPKSIHNETLRKVAAYVDGRYPSDERAKMVGVPAGKSGSPGNTAGMGDTLPLIHIMIPYTQIPDVGLDGVEIHLPGLPVKPTHGPLFPLNIRVKDPLWPRRDLADFSFSVKPNNPQTLWIDTRDRILPERKALYITLTGAGSDLTPRLLKGTRVRLVYKSTEKAKAEHVEDRLTQIKDLYASTVEEHPDSPRFNLFNRFMADYDDLIKVDPNNWLAKAYKYAETRDPGDRPEYDIPPAPPGIPEWAYLQVRYLRHIDHVISYYIDHRQISNGEFGGGLSDDDDFTNTFPASAFMGIKPRKTLKSLRLLMTGFFDQDRDPYDAPLKQRSLPLFTNGLATISTDLLHAYEDGVELVGQLELLDYGNPLYINRGMETAKRVMDDLTQVNDAGHRHFRSRYYSGTRMATEDPWQWSGARSYNLLHTAYMTIRYNGNPKLQQMVVQLADGLLAHRDKEGQFYPGVNFGTDKTDGNAGLSNAWQVLRAAYDYTGKEKYLDPIRGSVTQTRVFDPEEIARRYREEIKELGVRDYIDTKGSIWIDRILRNINRVQEDRLGGVAIERINHIYPENYVSWNIDKPDDYTSLALFLPNARPGSIDIVAYNLRRKPVQADMTAWKVKPGKWQVRQGIDTDGDQQIDSALVDRRVELERGRSVKLTFAPRENTIVHLSLIEPAETGYWERADLGMGPDDVTVEGSEVDVKVSSLGAIDSPSTSIELRDAAGHTVATGRIPAMEAPADLVPRWKHIHLVAPAGTDLSSGSIEIDPGKTFRQITRKNDTVTW